MQLPFHWVGCRFDGMDPAKELAAPLKLKSVELRKNNGFWICYEVPRS